jgi:lambda family phage portal protein
VADLAHADPYRGPSCSYGADARPDAVQGERRYKAARRDRDVFGSTPGGDADTDTLQDLPELRRRSAAALRNNPLAIAAVNAEVTSVVGTGLRYNASVDRDYLGLSEDESADKEQQIEAQWRLFSTSPNCDLGRKLTFAEQQDLAERSALARGDHFLAFVTLDRPRTGWPFSFSVQHIEADRVCNPHFATDTETLVAGIEKDAQGAWQRIHVANFHPLALTRQVRAKQWTALQVFGPRTGRQLVVHHHDTLRPEQTRGVPYLAPVLEVLKQLDKYIDAEVDRAVNSALWMAFVTTQDGDGLRMDDALLDERAGFYNKFQQKRYAIEPSSIANLFPGDSVEFADPKAPNPVADAFIASFARLCGAALEIPQEVLLRHFSSSYSAARGALLMAWQFFGRRRARLAARICAPTVEAVLLDAMSAGRIDLPGFLTDPLARQAWLAGEWIGDAPPILDENKAVGAARDRLEIGISTRKRETAALTGQDYDVVRRQRAKEDRDAPLPASAPAALPSAADLDREDRQ